MTPLRDIWRSLPVVVRRVGGVLGVALVVLGALLTTRPLTALIALVATIAIVLIAAAVAVVVQARTVRRLAVFLALVACAAAALVFLPLVVRSLPIALAILLGANAVRLIVLVAWAGGDLASRLTRCIFAVSSLLFAASAWIWPDVSTVVIAAAFAVALVVAGVILIVGALRTWRSPSMEGLSRGERHRTRAVLRGIGAVLALVLAGVTSWASFQLRAGTVSVDDFYAWNHPVPAVPARHRAAGHRREGERARRGHHLARPGAVRGRVPGREPRRVGAPRGPRHRRDLRQPLCGRGAHARLGARRECSGS